MTVVCPYCDKPAVLVGGNVIYPHRDDLTHKKFWMCEPCEAWVGCHPPDKKSKRPNDIPMGRLANADLRNLKVMAHAYFDPLWKSKEMTRTQAYAWLAKEVGMSAANMHIGMLDEVGCRAVIAVLKRRKRA